MRWITRHSHLRLYLQSIYLIANPGGTIKLYVFVIIFGIFMMILAQLPSFHSLRHVNLISLVLCLAYSFCAVAGCIYLGTPPFPSPVDSNCNAKITISSSCENGWYDTICQGPLTGRPRRTTRSPATKRTACSACSTPSPSSPRHTATASSPRYRLEPPDCSDY